MKNSAQVYTERSRSGFTLIELMVVVAIIAVLSVIGLTLFAGIQNKARNDRRRADIDAIAKALEVNKTPPGYVVLAGSQFTNGAIPAIDPQGYPYCANYTVDAQPADPAVWTTACPAAGTTWDPVSSSAPPAGNKWKICTSLEAEGATAAVAFCRTNAQ